MTRSPISNTELSGGIPKKKTEQSRNENRMYRMGWVAANLTLERQKLEADKQQASNELAGIMQTIMAKQAEQQMAAQQAQAQAQYQGSYDAANQHLQGYSNQLAGMLGGDQQQPEQQQQGQMMPPQGF